MNITNPTQKAILEHLRESRQAQTVREIATEINRDQNLVGWHIRELKSFGMVQSVKRRDTLGRPFEFTLPASSGAKPVNKQPQFHTAKIKNGNQAFDQSERVPLPTIRLPLSTGPVENKPAAK